MVRWILRKITNSITYNLIQLNRFIYTFTNVLPLTDEEMLVDDSVETLPDDGAEETVVAMFGNDVVPGKLSVLISSAF